MLGPIDLACLGIEDPEPHVGIAFGYLIHRARKLAIAREAVISCAALRRLHWKMTMPVLGDVDAAAKPDAFETAHVLQQPDQSAASSGSAD